MREAKPRACCRPGRALYLRGLQQLPARRPLAEPHRPRRAGHRQRGAARLPRRLLDRLGWKDRFASARFSERQYALTRQAGSRAVYTPGVFLNFQEFRGWGSARFGDALRAINGKPARADIRLELDTPSPAQLAIKADFRLKSGASENGQAFVALYEHRLSTDVKAGENRGVTLQHDYVVREWIGPIELKGAATLRKTLALQRDWKVSDLGVVAFVQDTAGREVMQATALPVCDKG